MNEKSKALAYVAIERANGWYWVLAMRSVEIRIVADGRNALPELGFRAANDISGRTGAETSNGASSPVD